jgi:hypothetical protein
MSAMMSPTGRSGGPPLECSGERAVELAAVGEAGEGVGGGLALSLEVQLQQRFVRFREDRLRRRDA